MNWALTVAAGLVPTFTVFGVGWRLSSRLTRIEDRLTFVEKKSNGLYGD